MGMNPEKPTETGMGQYEPKKIIINKHDLHNTRSLMDVVHPDVGYLASIYWVGKSPSGVFQDVYQPAIYCPEGINDRYLSYDGKASYILAGDKNDYDFLRYPFDASIYKMTPDGLHYFKIENPLAPNFQYALNSNNTSIIMNNISIYNENYSSGCMVNLRASFEGRTVDNNIDGNVVLIITIVNIP